MSTIPISSAVYYLFIVLGVLQRVYDEDVSQEDSAKAAEGNEEKEKTREHREAELIPKVKEALGLGINVIDQAFEQLDSHVADSDSEEEETGYRTDPLLEAKVSIKLPLHLFKSQETRSNVVGVKVEEVISCFLSSFIAVLRSKIWLCMLFLVWKPVGCFQVKNCVSGFDLITVLMLFFFYLRWRGVVRDVM